MRRVRFSLAAISALLLSSLAFAQTPAAKHYYDYLPVRDQDGIGICYAYTASELLDGYFLGNSANPGAYSKFCSPLEAAFFYKMDEVKPHATSIRKTEAGKQKDFFFESGWSCKIVDYFNKHGCCDHSALTDALGGMDPKTFLTELEKKVKQAEALGVLSRESLGQMISQYGFSTGLSVKLTATIEAAKASRSASRYALMVCRAGAPGTLSDYSSQMLQNALDGKITDVLKEAIAKACSQKARIYHKPIKCEELYLGVGGDAVTLARKRAELKAYFEKSPKRPLGIDYCSAFLGSGYSFKPKDDLSDCGAHASVLLDRRYNPKTKRIEYLLRNSWGTSLDYYADDVKKGGVTGMGSVWIPEEKLIQYMYQIEKMGD